MNEQEEIYNDLRDMLEKNCRGTSVPDDPIERTLSELSGAIHELDRRWLQDPFNVEQTKALRYLRNQCTRYYDDLIGNDLTEEQKLELCKRLVKC